GSNGMTALLVPRETRGLTIRPQVKATGATRGNNEPIIRWHHGPAAAVAFEDCRVSGDHLVGKDGQSTLAQGTPAARGHVEIAAVNLGLGRVAYETAVDYAGIRRQGGRNIIEHQAIGTKLADCAIRLELARNMIWKAAWALDRPDAQVSAGAELPLHVVARVYTAQAMHEVTLLAAECFGGMGVMRDMPLQKYVHDGLVFLHQEESDDAAKLRIAEALAGYQRPLAQTA
ncbi:MAG TPA: acyl-CoA dehydrogenase, partial [Burkholderiales bacterium]